MRLSNRRGFALPMAIFVIALLTVALTASFVSSSSERRVVDSQEAQVRAYNIAQQGLERYMAERTQLLDMSGEPTIATGELSDAATARPQKIAVYTGSPDSAEVLVYKVRSASGVLGDPAYIPASYIVRARGIDSERRLKGMPAAERTVAQMAVWLPGQLQVLAGWTSLSGLRKNGNSGTLSGVDHCGVKGQKAGIAVPNNGYSGQLTPITGDPKVRYLGTQAEANAAVQIDWDAIQNQNAIPADYYNEWPAANLFTNPLFWPIIHFKKDATHTGDAVLQSGRGMLIVDGNLAMQGNVTWDGIILVGGNITSNGNNTVYGAIVTGLDKKLGEDVISNELGNGTKIYQYDSCAVEKATASMGIMRPLTNTFTDSWATY